MINVRIVGWIGIAACVWFWLASFLFGALRPAYSHSVNTISELGAIGTPYAALWNIVGFGLTGLLLTVVGAVVAGAVGRRKSTASSIARLLLILAGIAIAGQGLIPAEMVDGVADIESPYTRGHFVSSLVSAGAWVLGALLLVGPMKRDARWRGWSMVSIALVLLTVVAAVTLRGALPAGLAQRLGNAVFLSWYVLMSLKLIWLGSESSVGQDEARRAAA